MNLEDIRNKLLEQKKYGHLLALDSTGYCREGELSNDYINNLLENINAKVRNVAIALDEWRGENEDQFDENSKDFNNWIGDTLEIQESLQDTDIQMEDLE